MSSISKTTLGDLIEFQRGYDLPKSQFISNYKTLSFGQGNVLTALPIFSDLVGF